MVKKADETMTCQVELERTGETMQVECSPASFQAGVAFSQLCQRSENDFGQMLLPEFCTDEQFEKLRAETAAQVSEMTRGQLVAMFAGMAMWNAQQLQLAIRQGCQNIVKRVDPAGCTQI